MLLLRSSHGLTRSAVRSSRSPVLRALSSSDSAQSSNERLYSLLQRRNHAVSHYSNSITHRQNFEDPVHAFIKSNQDPNGDAELYPTIEPPSEEEEQNQTEMMNSSNEEDMGRTLQDLKKALRDEEYDAILPAFIHLSRSIELLQALPMTFLAEVIRSLNPRNYLDTAKSVYTHMHPYNITRLHDSTRQLKNIFIDSVRLIRAVAIRLRKAGKKLGIREFTTLLDAARASGDGELAVYLLVNMRRDGVQPDTRCYNYYFEALTWDLSYEPLRALQLRITPRYLQNSHPNRLTGLSAAYAKTPNVYKGLVMGRYAEMVQEGIESNTTTYSLFMHLMSGEGDLQSVKSVLMKVWEIDVDEIMDNSSDSSIFEPALPPDSPVYPNQDLLFTIAHVFGSNNEVPTALRLVDHVSRKFNIPIDFEVWQKLVEWTFVLSTKRYGAHPSLAKRRRNDTIGQVSLDSFEKLWRTMTSEPYNVQPDELMYNRRIKSLWRLRDFPTLIGAMEECRKRLGMPSFARKALRTYFDFSITTEQRIELENALKARIGHMLSRWTKLVLGTSVRHDKTSDWTFRALPRFLKRWMKHVAGSGAAYNIDSGRIQFHPIFDNKCSMAIEIFPTTSAHTLIRPTSISTAEPYHGVTRFARVSKRNQYRNSRRTWSAYPEDDPEEDPNFVEPHNRQKPQWFESEAIVDWRPPEASRPSSESSSIAA